MTNWETIAVPSPTGNFVSPLYRPAAVQSVICHLSFSRPTACLRLESHFIKPLAAMSSSSQTLDGIEIKGPIAENFSEILTPDALRFVARLQREFNGRRKELLERREKRQAEIDQSKKPDFLPETAHIREGDWRGAPLPNHLQDLRGGN